MIIVLFQIFSRTEIRVWHLSDILLHCLLFHEEMSLNIDINRILPVKFSVVSPNLHSKLLTSSLGCNVLNPGKIFHSNSIGSPSILSKFLYNWLSTMTVIALKTRVLSVETPVVALARVHGCSLVSSMEEGEFHIFTVLFKTFTIWSIACCTYVSMSTSLQKTDNVWRSCFWQGLTRDAMRYQRFPRLVRVLSIRGRSSQRRWCSGGRL